MVGGGSQRVHCWEAPPLLGSALGVSFQAAILVCSTALCVLLALGVTHALHHSCLRHRFCPGCSSQGESSGDSHFQPSRVRGVRI